MKRLILPLAAALLLSALSVLVGPAPAGAVDASAEQRFVELLNHERVSRGLGALSTRTELVTVARGWTGQMIRTQKLAHNPNLSSQVPSDWLRIGENVGKGSTADSLHSAFMASTAHRANILGDFNQLGVGADRDGAGRLWVTVVFMKSSVVQAASTTSSGACGPNTNPAPAPSGMAASGYYVLGGDGGIFSYGNATYHGSLPGLGVRATSVLMAVTPSDNGYWVLGADGGIFSFGDARFFGSLPGVGVRNTGVDLKPTPKGNGYWILGADGGIFSFGDARFFGSLPGLGVSTRAIRLVPTPSGNGYWILGADGGIFSFGDAKFFGSLPGIGVRNTAVTLAPTPKGNGYWILGADGGIFSFGDARFYGSVPGIGLCHQVNGVQLAATTTGGGYYIVSDRGQVFAFGDAPGLGDPSRYGISARDVAIVAK